MITIGVDAHKKTHTLVAVDQVGHRLAEVTLAATTAGHLRAVQWADAVAGGDGDRQPVRFAVEDCRHLTRRLEADLLGSGQQVARVHTHLMAAARRGSRRPGKSDPIDAEAVALAALREPDLPVAQLDGPSREVKLLTDARADLVVQRTQAASRLRWFLHELNPELVVPPRGLRRTVVVAALATWLADAEGVVARLARDLLSRIAELNNQIKQLEREVRGRVRALAPSLLEVPGCGETTAAVLLGETADVRRFRSADGYARFTGTAPIPVWSGNTERVRLNRGGNRTTNCALHTIAITQAARGIGGGKDYVDKQLTRGKTRTEALRLLRRRLSDRVYAALRADAPSLAADSPQPAQQHAGGRSSGVDRAA